MHFSESAEVILASQYATDTTYVVRTFDHPDRVVDDVHSLATCELQYFFLPVWLAIVHAMVGPAMAYCNIDFVL